MDQFTTEPKTVIELERRLRVSDMVMKFQSVRIDEKLKKIEKRKKEREKRAARKPAPPAAPAAPEPPAPPLPYSNPPAPPGAPVPTAPLVPSPISGRPNRACDGALMTPRMPSSEAANGEEFG